MAWQFYGYAAIYGVPDTDGDIFLPGCFHLWLNQLYPGSLPMTNGHDGPEIGEWLHVGTDNLGLRVVGQIREQRLLPLDLIVSGLSVTPINSQGSPQKTPQGGGYVRITEESQIALVAKPKQPLARILGEWSWF